jgi:type I restriction enzyme S subunit
VECCQLFTDGDWIETKDQSPTGIRLIQTGNIGVGTFKNRKEKARYVSEETFLALRCTEIREGDSLISRLPEPVGRSCILPSTGERMITAVDCTIARFHADTLLPEFFNYYSQSTDYLKTVDASTTGTTRKRISRSSLGSVRIPLPPIAQQRRIVYQLDLILTDATRASANAERNVQNARSIYRSHLSTILAQVPQRRRLGDLATIARGGSPRPIEKYLTASSNGVNWVKISDASASDKYIYKTAQKIDPSGVSRSRLVNSGDFLLSNSMSFGRPYIMRTTGCIHDGWLVLSDTSGNLDQDYLYHVLSSPLVYEQFDGLASGSTVRNLNIELASQVRVPVPSLAQQREIAQQCDEVLGQVTELEAIYARKLTALEQLKQSLLHQAFTGAL